MTPTILHVLEAFAGGTEQHLLDIVRHIDACEHIIAVPSVHQGKSTAAAADVAAALGARVERLEMGRSRAAHRSLTAIPSLRRLIRSTGADVVHGHSSIGGAVARLAVWTVPVPVVYTPHGVSRSRWALRIERGLGMHSDRVIAVSAGEREFLLVSGLAREEQVVVIPNGIDLDPPAPLSPSLRSRLDLPHHVPLVGCVGRLTWQKAPEIYVEACALTHRVIPDAHFVLIGSGPLQRRVEALVGARGLAERFHLLPGLANAGAALSELDLYVLPSRFEGGPYTPLEAMRGRTPVLVSDATGNRDAVVDGVSGLVVAQDDPGALSESMIAVLEDPELSDRLVCGALEHLPRFDVKTMADATTELYAALVGTRSRRAVTV